MYSPEIEFEGRESKTKGLNSFKCVPYKFLLSKISFETMKLSVQTMYYFWGYEKVKMNAFL